MMQESISSEVSQQLTPRTKVEIKTPRQDRTPTQRRREKVTIFRSKSRQNFMTDTQASDNTVGKSSSSLQIKLSVMQQKLRRLSKQNTELKECIINMKANKFYTINEQKVRQVVSQNEKLRNQIMEIQKINEQLLIQNEFLQRNNHHLKSELQNLASKHLRKSIDASKTKRQRQNTKKSSNNFNLNNEQPFSQINLAQRLTHQKKILHQTRSNPNLLNQKNPKYQINSNQFFFKENIQNQDKNFNDNLKSFCKITLNNKLKNSNEHFLKQFEKYERQNIHPNLKKQSVQEKLDSRNEILTPRNNKSPINNRKLVSSKSKETSLQTMLEKKQQMMNSKARLRQNRSKGLQNQQNYDNDQNDQMITNRRVGSSNLNDDKNYQLKQQKKSFNDQKKKTNHDKVSRMKEFSSKQQFYHPRG